MKGTTKMAKQAAARTLRKIDTSLGELTLVAEKDAETGRAALAGVYFPDHQPAPQLAGVSEATTDEGLAAVLDQATREIIEYLGGARASFEVPFVLEGTALQEDVWRALLSIPRGETRTYGELAASIGKAGAPRAIGQQVARNPLSIVVPCHRVLATGARLNGFAGGVARKAQLLSLESAAFHVPRARAKPEDSEEARGSEAPETAPSASAA